MNYYNEFDPRAAAWLRELIQARLIPEGKVDERDIRDVRGADLAGFAQCHFFAGIGGWPLALALAGWPQEKPVWTGSCPCQPFSVAGKGRGKKDPRHLWPEFHRLIAECRPPMVFGEQVASKAGRQWLAGVFAQMEALAYAVAGADLCAAGIRAPHIRQRLYWMADSMRSGRPAWRPKSGNRQASRRIGFGRMEESSSIERRIGGALHGGDAFAEHHHTPGAGETGGLGEPIQPGLEGQSGHGNHGHQPGWHDEEPHRPVTATGAVGGMALTTGEQKQPASAGGLYAESGSGGAWGDFDIIPCRDGKSRRVESGTFPLAHGISGRVGLLRGYGNAIVPQLAAEFIRAAVEVI